jgi:hypothetical protein
MLASARDVLSAGRSESKRSIILAAEVTAPGVLQIVLNTVSACGNMTAAVSQTAAE